jgi:hypothetical protein
MSIKFTAEDLSQLDEFRLERFRELYAQALVGCRLELKFNALLIHCSEPWCVDQLMEELDRMVNAVSLVLGAKYLSICYATEEVYRTKTRLHRQQCMSH